jgi:hypothetical protein
MTANNQRYQLLRRAALSAAMLLTAAPAAFADPPGYLFKDFEPAAPAVVGVPPQHPTAANAGSSLSTAQARDVCVALGLDPSADPYGHCITNLQRLVWQSEQAQNHSAQNHSE